MHSAVERGFHTLTPFTPMQQRNIYSVTGKTACGLGGRCGVRQLHLITASFSVEDGLTSSRKCSTFYLCFTQMWLVLLGWLIHVLITEELSSAQGDKQHQQHIDTEDPFGTFSQPAASRSKGLELPFTSDSIKNSHQAPLEASPMLQPQAPLIRYPSVRSPLHIQPLLHHRRALAKPRLFQRPEAGFHCMRKVLSEGSVPEQSPVASFPQNVNTADQANSLSNVQSKEPQSEQSSPITSAPRVVNRSAKANNRSKTQAEEVHPNQATSANGTAFSQQAFGQVQDRSNIQFRRVQSSSNSSVDATAFGATRSASHHLIKPRADRHNHRSNIQVNGSQPSRQAPIDATSLGSDPAQLSQSLIQRVSNQFRSNRGAVRNGITGGVRRGNFSRGEGKEQTSRSSRTKKSGPRRRKNDSDNELVDYQEEASPEVIEYRKSRQALRRGFPVAFTPEQPTVESLTGMAPALAASTQGMSKFVLERLRQIELERERVVKRVEVLARMEVAGVKPHSETFENKEQEDRTKKRVEQLLSIPHTHSGDAKVGKETKETPDKDNMHEIPEVIKTDLVGKLVSGSYQMQHPAVDDGRDILGHAGRLINRNGSYRLADEQSFIQKIQNLLPVRKGSSNIRRVRA